MISRALAAMGFEVSVAPWPPDLQGFCNPKLSEKAARARKKKAKLKQLRRRKK